MGFMKHEDKSLYLKLIVKKSMKIVFFLVILISFIMIEIGIYQNGWAQESRNYYVYADPIPDYATEYASNAIPDAMKAWETANPNLHFYLTNNQQQADLIIQWVKDFGQIRNGQEIVGKVVQVGLGDSNCGATWQPFSSSYVTQITEHEIGHFLGFQHTTNPNDLMYGGLLSNYGYGTVVWTKNLDTGYTWFVPACTTKSVTSFAYSISLSRQDDAFDVYFVPSIDEYNKYANRQQFQYYQGNGCFGTNLISYRGVCQGVAQGSGLLISTHGHILINHLVTVTAELTEQSIEQPTNIPILSEPSGTSNPPSQQVANQSNTPNTTSYSSWITAIIIMTVIGGGLTAMRYASKR